MDNIFTMKLIKHNAPELVEIQEMEVGKQYICEWAAPGLINAGDLVVAKNSMIYPGEMRIANAGSNDLIYEELALFSEAEPDQKPVKMPGELDDCVSYKSESSENTAMRFNTGKPELSYILSAPNAIKNLAEVFQFGAEKYARDNWKNGLDREKIVDSLMRHLVKAENGEVLDDESGLPHLSHVLWNALVLAEQYIDKGDNNA